MERKKASDFPQELLDLFDGYVHGGISRRQFFDRAQKFAVGGVPMSKTSRDGWRSPISSPAARVDGAWMFQHKRSEPLMNVPFETGWAKTGFD